MKAAMMCSFTELGKASKNTLMLSMRNFFKNLALLLFCFFWDFCRP